MPENIIMKKHLAPFFVLLLVTVSCKRFEHNIPYPAKAKQAENKKAPLETEQYLENDIVLGQLESDLANYVKNPKFSIKKEPIDNKNVDNVVDTVKVFSFKNIHIESYKTVTEEWIIAADIKNPKIEFSNVLKIGTDKKSFEKILDAKIMSDKLKVGNSEETSVFTFTFKNNILQEINYEGYVD
jgi:hypothetical protein